MNIHLSSFFSKRVSNNKPQTVQNVNKTNDLPSLELVFDLVEERITAQLMQVDGLDNKANFIKGAATGCHPDNWLFRTFRAQQYQEQVITPLQGKNEEFSSPEAPVLAFKQRFCHPTHPT